MIVARLKSLWSWSRITALLLAYYALGSFCSTGTQLWELIVFVSESKATQAQVIDMRRKEVDSWVELLNTGEPLLLGSPKYFPIVTYADARGPLSCELLEARSEPYLMGEMIPLRVHESDARVCKESHGCFLWGASLLRLLLSSFLLYLAYRLFRRKTTQRASRHAGAAGETLLKLNEKLQRSQESVAESAPQQNPQNPQDSPKPKKTRKPRAKASPKSLDPEAADKPKATRARRKPKGEEDAAAPVKKTRKPRQARVTKDKE